MRRLASVIAAAALLLSGCGGSDVTGAEGITATQPEQADAQSGLPGAGGTAPDAGAGSAAALHGQSGSANTAAAPSSRGETGTSTDSRSGKGGEQGGPGAAKGPGTAGAGKTATGLAGAAERLVQTSPLFGGNGTCKPATLSEVRVGNLSTLSGVLGELFAPVVPALNTFVTSQNACGGLNGHRIKLVQRDDQGDPSTAITLAQQMIQSDKILAFVGNIQVLTLQAIVPTIKKYGVPIFGGDLTGKSWFEHSLIFPQGSSIQSFAVAYLSAIKNRLKETVIGNLWCIEVPAACGAVNTALHEMAPQFGIKIATAPQVSITAPSYVQQCLEMKNAGVKAVILSVDAATAVRFARSCEQVGFAPETLIHQIGIGNEKQFFGNAWLGGTYAPLNVFPHMADQTPATRYYQASVRKFNPGFASGGAASVGWSAAALLAAAAANLPEVPTTQSLLDTAYEFKGQEFTKLGGLTPAPLTFVRDGKPRVPYCHYYVISNEQNNGWASYASKPSCSNLLAPSDPQSGS